MQHWNTIFFLNLQYMSRKDWFKISILYLYMREKIKESLHLSSRSNKYFLLEHGVAFILLKRYIVIVSFYLFRRLYQGPFLKMQKFAWFVWWLYKF